MTFRFGFIEICSIPIDTEAGKCNQNRTERKREREKQIENEQERNRKNET